MSEELEGRLRSALRAEVDELPFSVTRRMVEERMEQRPSPSPVRVALAGLTIVAAVVVVLVVGPALLPRPGREASGPISTAAPSAPASAAATPSDDAAIRYVCIPDHPSFTIEELLNAPPADAVNDPPLAVLADTSYQGFPPLEAWRRVVQTDDAVVFMAEWPGGDAPYMVVNVVPGGPATPLHDGWGADSYGACTPRPVTPEGVDVADWYVDLAAGEPGPETDTLPIFVHERQCASGQPATGRILEPVVDYGEDEVTVTIMVRTIGGECPSNPLTPFTIQLDEPLGDRVLVDGGQFPLGDPFELPEGVAPPRD